MPHDSLIARDPARIRTTVPDLTIPNDHGERGSALVRLQGNRILPGLHFGDFRLY
jgi:hypothetical protein